MDIDIGMLVVLGLIALGIVAMLTGNDGELLAKIVDYLAGVAIGAGVSLARAKMKTPEA